MQGAMALQGGQKVGRAQAQQGGFGCLSRDLLGHSAGSWGSQGTRVHTCHSWSQQQDRVLLAL